MFDVSVNHGQISERGSDFVHRAIFCTYWLYFYGFRGFLGHERLLDYIGMAFVLLGLMRLVSTKLLDSRLVGWVTILCCPLILTVILDPSMYVILFVFKTYVLALYFASYFKSMRLTVVEFVCFAVPVVVSVYYFLYPRPSEEWLLSEGRMSGISEPNFTSLSLIYAMCGAFGIYVLTRMKRTKVAAIVTALLCFCGVILTASRAGFIGATIALCLFLVIEKRVRYAGVAVAVAAAIIALNSGSAFQNKLVVLQRFQDIGASDSIIDPGKDLLIELAWDEIHRGEWFIGGGPQRVSEWAYSSISVPHNSLLDIGVAFGKASFYFYGGLLVALLAVNVLIVVANWRCRDHEEKNMLLAPTLFLSLFPMYMFLSAGLAMDFILWLVLGAYPLLHASPKPAKASSKNCIYHYVKV